MDRERTRLFLARCTRCGRVFDEEGFGAHAKPGGFIPCYGFTAEHIEVIPANSIEPLREALREILATPSVRHKGSRVAERYGEIVSIREAHEIARAALADTEGNVKDPRG